MFATTDMIRRPGTFRLGDIFATNSAERRLRRAQRSEYRRVRDELTALSDRDLRDIGLGRSEIERIAQDSAAQVRI